MGLNYSQNKSGFSLLELIIAIAILTTGIIVVLQAFSYSARITGLSSDIIQAVSLTQDKMQELEFKEKQGLLTQEPSEVEGKEGKFEWQYLLEADTDLKLYNLNFSIWWQRANRKEEIILNTFLK